MAYSTPFMATFWKTQECQDGGLPFVSLMISERQGALPGYSNVGLATSWRGRESAFDLQLFDLRHQHRRGSPSVAAAPRGHATHALLLIAEEAGTFGM